ncbi:MAG: N-acetyltransferase [Pseudomonadota bacterium]
MIDSPFRSEQPPTAARACELSSGLAEAGQALTQADLRPFLFYLTDDQDVMTAGCKGEIAFRSAHISELWVDPELRGQGIGRTLLAQAEAHARMQNCIRIHIETRNERARSLYEACGYHVFGKLERYENDTCYYYLEKPLE